MTATEQAIKPGQIWQRKKNGRRLRVLSLDGPTVLYEWLMPQSSGNTHESYLWEYFDLVSDEQMKE